MIINAAIKAGLSKQDTQALAGWLGELLVSQQFAKLTEGGHVQGSISLKSLFIDLPATGDVTDTDTRFKVVDSLESARFIKARDLSNSQILTSPSGIEEEKKESGLYKSRGNFENIDSSSAVLLIGGPGQGKSTVGQLLCQLYRAHLLKGYKGLSAVQKNTVDEYVRRKAGDIVLRNRSSPTLPIQINLPDFAGWLSKNARERKDIGASLALTFICQTPSAQEHLLRPSTILLACKSMNIQLVFDGFDEVGSQTERLRLVAECRNFISELSDQSAQVRVLVTTRPQGYTEEFEKIGFKLTKFYLLPLKVEEALVYAYRLIKAKILSADERNRAQKLIDIAVDEPATKRLFTTPLQITIITALVQQMGNAPRERWNLFAGYFDYTYKREVERQTFASVLLRDQRQNIEQMHARVGLILQVRSELEGGASSRMTRPELEEIINDILEEEEIPLDRKTKLISDIATAAEDRLVFLTQPEPENYGFEVRSLQEFFAAWSLTTGVQSDVEARLNRISQASAFKNVYLFAASRIFGSIQTYRESWISHVCKWYDNPLKDKFSSEIRAGSLIALETLEEGVALNQPKYAKILMGLACGVLSRPPGKEHVRLAHACSPDNEQQLENALSLTLQGLDEHYKTSAWVVLIECINQKLPWAIKCAERFFDISKWDIFRPALAYGSAQLNPWLSSKFEQNLGKISPEDIFIFRPSAATNSWLETMLSIGHSNRNLRWWKGPNKLRSSADYENGQLLPYTGHLHWDAIISTMNFETKPSAEMLATACVRLSKIDTTLTKSLLFRSTWPISSIIKFCNDKKDFLEISEKLKQGLLGDFSDWSEAQDQWPEEFSITEVLACTNPNAPWTTSTLKKSPSLQFFAHHSPLSNAFEGLTKTKVANLITSLNDIFIATHSTSLKNECADLILNLLEFAPKRYSAPAEDTNKWIDYSHRAGFYALHRLSIMPEIFWQKIINRIETNDYMGPPSLIANSIRKTHGNPNIISLSLHSISTHFDLTHEDHDSTSSENYLKALEYVKKDEKTSKEHGILIWEVVTDIKLGRLDLSKYDTSKLSKLHANIISAALKQGNLFDQKSIENFSLSLIDANPELLQSRQIIDALQDIFIRRRSGLSDPAIWSSLHMGFYYTSASKKFANDSDNNIRTISSLNIQNLRGISKLTHNFSSDKGDTGQFIVLIGENGAGKTTILRAIALALRDSSDLSIWPAGAFSASWRSEGLDSSIPGKIILGLGDESSIETTITSSGQFKQSSSSQDASHPVFAYGCYRGSALGSLHRNVGLGEDGGPGISTLFDSEARLINAESWLIQLEARSLKEPDRNESYKTVISSLCELLGLADLRIRSGNLYAETLDKQFLPFSALSDGYLSMSGWFIDVVARWVEFLDHRNQPVNKNFLKDAQCYILIDEIDAHIHPGWQLDIIHRAKTIFPKCVFVVTTHNPLTLAGASPHEILLLKRTGQDIELIKGAMPPILLTGGQLYKQYFGIDQVIPTQVAKLIAKKINLESQSDLTEREKTELKNTKIALEKLELEGWEHVR